MFQSQNPATGEVWATFEELTVAELETKFERAAHAFQTYRQTSLAARARWLRNAADILDESCEGLAQLIVREVGKTIGSARQEIAKCAACCRFYAEHGPQLLADERVATEAGRSFVRFQPLGPVLAVMPWNFPFWQVFRFAAPALMAGNVGLLKHAPNVPMCARAIEEVLENAGFPNGAFQQLLISAPRTEKLLDDARIVAATLTGSERAGRALGAAAGRNLKKIVLELGGSDPFIVMPSADLDTAARVAVQSRLLCNGQSCIAAKRFIVHTEIYEEFRRRFIAGLEAVKIGDPMDESIGLGPLVSATQRAVLHAQVEASVAAGARLTLGGGLPDGPGFYYPPTLLEAVPRGAPAYTQELFGPVACLYRAENFAAALELANDTPFGLGAALWSNDAAEIEAFTQAIESGSAFVNALVASDARLPFGGVKNSGIGRELGAFGLREFTNIKTVWVA